MLLQQKMQQLQARVQQQACGASVLAPLRALPPRPQHQPQPQQRSRRHVAHAAATAPVLKGPAQPMEKRAVQTSVQDGPNIVKDIDCIIFDCDGVLWRGFTTIQNSPETLQALRAQGKRLLFVTNNAGKSRKGYVKRFTSVGLDVKAEEIVPASYAAAAYLESVNFKATGKKVLLLANNGVEEELMEHGIPYLGGENWVAPRMDTADAVKDLKIDEDIGAVVVGFDHMLDYSRLVYASCCLRELPGCLYVATNLDPNDNLGQPTAAPFGKQLRRLMPVTGCMVSALSCVGQDPVVAGKGGAWLFPFLMARYNLDPSRTAMVGDRLDTDILLGAEGGLRTIMPMTGVTTPEELADAVARSDEPGALPVPDFVIPSVAALAGLP